MLTTRWNNVEIKLYQRCFNVVSTSDTYVVSKLWNVENPTSDFLSFSTSDFVSFSLIHNVETTLIRRWNVGWVVICNKIKKVSEKRTLKTEGEEGDWIKFFFFGRRKWTAPKKKFQHRCSGELALQGIKTRHS